MGATLIIMTAISEVAILMAPYTPQRLSKVFVDVDQGGHSVQISDSDIDNIVTLYRLRHASGRPADVTWYMCYTGRPNDT